jgi:hypothetical protein
MTLSDCVPCPRFSARLSPACCAARYRGAEERYPQRELFGCRGCPLGAVHARLMPLVAHEPRRPAEGLRAMEGARIAEAKATKHERGRR